LPFGDNHDPLQQSLPSAPRFQVLIVLQSQMDESPVMRIQRIGGDRLLDLFRLVAHFERQLSQGVFSSPAVVLGINHHVDLLVQSFADHLVHNELQGIQRLPFSADQKSGSIVNISSIAGFLGSAGAIAYGASKWAVRGMTKAAGIELAKHGIRVNSIHPGMIDTDMMTEVTGGDAERFERIERTVPMRRVAAPEEVAKLALFLASDDSAYCTASEFIVDGGVTAV